MKSKKEFYWEAYGELYPSESKTMIALNLDLDPALEKAMDNYAYAMLQPESKEVESVPVKSAEEILGATLDNEQSIETIILAMERYANQFKQPANNESLEKKALKYANDFVFPIKGVEYGYSYLQELKAQRDLIKDAYMAGAANNDAVKVIEERIKELEATPTGWQDSERIILIEELKHILKLIQ